MAGTRPGMTRMGWHVILSLMNDVKSTTAAHTANAEILSERARSLVPALRQRGHERDRTNTAALLRREKHPRVTRMHRKAQHLPAERGDSGECCGRGALTPH